MMARKPYKLIEERLSSHVVKAFITDDQYETLKGLAEVCGTNKAKALRMCFDIVMDMPPEVLEKALNERKGFIYGQARSTARIQAEKRHEPVL